MVVYQVRDIILALVQVHVASVQDVMNPHDLGFVIQVNFPQLGRWIPLVVKNLVKFMIIKQVVVAIVSALCQTEIPINLNSFNMYIFN